MKVELLTIPGCPNGEAAAALLRDVLRALAPGTPVEAVVIATAGDALGRAFPGSPTIRLDGIDVEPDPPAGAGLC